MYNKVQQETSLH